MASQLFHETLLLGLSTNDEGKKREKQEEKKKLRGREIIAKFSSLSSKQLFVSSNLVKCLFDVFP